MKNDIYLSVGRLFFGTAILAIGVVHFATNNFPTGLLPVAASFTGKTILVYLTGAAMIIAGLLIIIKKYTCYGALLAGCVFLIFFIWLHVPLLTMNSKDGGEWTATFEVFAFLSGALILLGTELSAKNKINGYKFLTAGLYFFAICLLVFGGLHFVYEKYIVTLIPAWLPFGIFWSYVVMIGFFAVFVSIRTQICVRLSSLLLGLMYMIWVLILHLPLVITHIKVEPQWSSLFVALAMSGIGFLIAGSTINEHSKKQ